MITELPIEHLTPGQENKLARAKTEEARNTLVLHSMREAIAYAHKCCRGRFTQDELFSLCYEYLQAAAKRFSPDRIRFFAYAKVDIRRGIAQAWRAKDVVRGASIHQDDFEPAIRPPDTRSFGGDNGGHDYRELTQENIHGFNSPEELMGEYGAVVDPEFAKIHIKERWQMVKPIIKAKLTETEQMVIDLYYNGDLTFEQIGDLLNVSRAAIQMLQFKALKKIRCELMRRKTLYSE